ncbi:MAG TPA: OsmC family protein [Gemmatimonadaceae bacterium]|nr:OsmC family protein [Gemmatimonadaceae bacterium]
MTAPVASTVSRPPAVIHVEWEGEHRFDAGRPGGPAIRIDSSGKTAQSPVDTLLSALATCTASDVVDILEKRRTPIQSLQIDVIGERVDTVPRRFRHITLTFHITGEGIEREQAERAIELSVNKYCSVRDSLSRDIVVDWRLDLKVENPDE